MAALIKVQTTQSVLHRGDRIEAGEVMEVEQETADSMCERGLAVLLGAKPAKASDDESAPAHSTVQPIDSMPAGKKPKGGKH